VVAVDDDIERAGIEGVDDGNVAGPLVDEGLGVAPVRLGGERLGVDLADLEAVGTDWTKGRVDDRRRGGPVVLRGFGDRTVRRLGRGHVTADGRGGVDRSEDVRRCVAERPGRLVTHVSP
jgi:hypothetical protein